MVGDLLGAADAADWMEGAETLGEGFFDLVRVNERAEQCHDDAGETALTRIP